MRKIFLVLLVLSGCVLCAQGAVAGPELTIEAEGTTTLRREDIEKMPHHIVRTTTPWTIGVTEFEGVLLRDLPGVDGQSDIEVEALNAYAAHIPADEIKNLDIILAYKVNGIYPSVREKGPFWVIYPRDNLPHMSRQVLDMRMVWQVRRIKVGSDGQ